MNLLPRTREPREIFVRRLASVAWIGVGVLATLPGGSAEVRAQTPPGLQPLPQSMPAEDSVIARVNGEEVRQSDVLRMLEQLPAEVRGMPREQLFALVVERAIDRFLVVEAARKEGLRDDPEIQRRLEAAEADVLWEAYLERKLQEGLSEARIRRAYDKIASEATDDEIKARHILLASEEDARTVIRELEGGADFQTLARKRSIGPSREAGGDLGYFSRAQMVDEFSGAAFALAPGEFSKAPVKTQFGWHVILVEGRRRAETPSMQEAMPQIQQAITREVLTEVLGGLRKRADIEIVGTGGGLVRPGAR